MHSQLFCSWSNITNVNIVASFLFSWYKYAQLHLKPRFKIFQKVRKENLGIEQEKKAYIEILLSKLPKLAEKIEDHSIFSYILVMQIDNKYQKIVSSNTREK